MRHPGTKLRLERLRVLFDAGERLLQFGLSLLSQLADLWILHFGHLFFPLIEIGLAGCLHVCAALLRLLCYGLEIRHSPGILFEGLAWVGRGR